MGNDDVAYKGNDTQLACRYHSAIGMRRMLRPADASDVDRRILAAKTDHALPSKQPIGMMKLSIFPNANARAIELPGADDQLVGKGWLNPSDQDRGLRAEKVRRAGTV